MVYLYHVEKRINDVLKGRAVEEVTYTPENETYDDVCYVYALNHLGLDESDLGWSWNFDNHRSFNGLYVCRFYSTDEKPLKVGGRFKKQVFVYIDLNKTVDLHQVAISWY